MFGLISFFTIISVFQITVLGDVSKIGDVQACTEFCSASNSVGNFKDGQCTCENVDNKDALNVLRVPRQVDHVDPSLYSNDLTDEERTARCTLGSRNHLRHYDADRVVKYFVNDGPSQGHSYFVGAAKANDDTNKDCKTDNNPTTNLYRNSDDSKNLRPEEQAFELVEDNSYQPDYGDSFVGAPYDPYNPVYFAPTAVYPYEHTMDSTYSPLLGSTNYILNSPIHSTRLTPQDRLLGAKLQRRTIRPRLSTLKHFSNALLGLVREPINEGLLNAHSFLHSLTKPDLTAYSSPYIHDLGTISRSSAKNFITETNPIVGISNEKAQTYGVDSENASENNTQESFDAKKSTNMAPSVPRANIPTGNFLNTPYDQQYFMPLYPPINPNGAFVNSIPRAYILQPVKIIPQATRSAQSSDDTIVSKSQDPSNCQNSTSSDNKVDSMDSANETTEKSKENIDTTDSSITKRDSNKEKILKSKNKAK